LVRVCDSTAVRAVALLGPVANEQQVKQFELPGVNLFSGNELDPTDRPEAALIFGGDGTLHRHLGGLAQKQIPALIVPLGSGNDFAQSIGIESVRKALVAWRRFCSTGDNTRLIDLGTIRALEQASGSAIPDPTPWQGAALESLHFVPSGPRADLPALGPRIMQSQLRQLTAAEREVARTTFYACLAGTGLDAAVNRLTLRQPRWVRAHGGYVVGLLRLFRVVYRGAHVGMKEVEYFTATRIRIQTRPATEVFADGEYICNTPVEIGVQRNALRVIVEA